MKLSKKFNVLKRIAATMLATVLLFSLASCKNIGKTEDDEVKIPAKKVAILVAPEAQYPEDYRAAQELAAEYPNSVVIKEYDDSRILKAGDPGIITHSVELANNPEIGAIIYARATQYTRNAIYKAKEINPDIITVCVEPEEDIKEIAELSNLVYCVDWAKAAEDVVAQAKTQGAKYFVTFSFSRHISGNSLIRSEIDAFKKACEAQGITYIYENSEDTNKSTQIPGAQKYIKEAVARLYLNNTVEGSDVALFSTDSSVQSTLIEQANSRGLIYVCPSFPTAYNGLGEVYDIETPEKISDIDKYIKNAKDAVEADTEGTGRLCIYKYPLATALLKAALYSAFDMMNETMTAENMAEKAIARANLAADSKDFTVSAYDNSANVYMAYLPGFEIIR
ncbi:MAG: DUF3798 domain-containing protein [Ruminococcaceae bacterium]|nr:DUF3798 domain-containing protein [Oscillospiraceae bacterium]